MPKLCFASGNQPQDPSSASIAFVKEAGQGPLHQRDYGYAEVGYWTKRGQSSLYYFAEYQEYQQPPTSATVDRQFGQAPLSKIGSLTTHEYEVAYDNGGWLDMNVDFTYTLQSNFNPYSAWYTPWEPQWKGNAHDYGDEMPGHQSPSGFSPEPINFTQLGVLTSGSNSWITPPCSVTSYANGEPGGQNVGFRFNGQWTASDCSQFNLWTLDS